MQLSAYACFAALLLAHLSGPSLAAEMLRWKFKTGDKLHYRMRQDTQTRTQIGARDLKSSIQQVIDQSWHVKKVAEDGTADVGLSFDRMRIKYDTPNGVIQIDTAGEMPTVGELTGVDAALRGLTGAEFSIKMSPQGDITQIVLPEHVQKLIDAAAGSEPLQSGISEEGLKAMIAQSTVVMPKETVQPGDDWNSERSQLGAKLALHYHYAGQQQVDHVQVATVDVTGEITFEPQPVPELSFKLAQQEVKGVIHFDAAAGRLHDMRMIQKTAVDMTSGNTSGRQEIQVIISSQLIESGADRQPQVDLSADNEVPHTP